MISTDRKIFETGSAVRTRIIEYGSLCDELNVIVFSRRSRPRLAPVRLSKNTFAYPTNSLSRFLYAHDAMRIGRRLFYKPLTHAGDGRVVISAQDPFETGLVAWRLSRKFGTKLQLQVHTDLLSPFFRQGDLMNKIRVMIAKFLLPRADAVRVVSQRIRDSLVARGVPEKKITVVPVLVDLSMYEKKGVPPEPGLADGFTYRVIMVSRLTKEKEVGRAFRAFARATVDMPLVGLVVVGDGPLLPFLRLEAKRLGIEKRVTFTLWRSDTASLYHNADIFLSASRYEGYGMTFVEAAAAGLPIVSTDVGAVREIFGNAGALLCPVGDTGCLAEKLRTLLSDGSQRRALGAKAAEAAKAAVGTKDAYLALYKESLEACFPS